MTRKLSAALIAVIAGLTLLQAGPWTSPASAAVEVQLSASSEELACGSRVTLTAHVADGGSPVTDGTIVRFFVGGELYASDETSGGVASVILVSSNEPVDVVTLTATVGDASDSVLIAATCRLTQEPASVSLAVTPTTVACGSQASVLATVRDTAGNLAADGTLVSFTASGNGAVVQLAPTISGVAASVFTAFPNTSGAVQVTATITGTTITVVASLQVTCAAGAISTVPVPPTVVVPIAAPAGAITPPNTGDGGLR